MNFQYPGHKAEKHHEIPGLLSIKVWLGLHQQEEEWHKMQKEGDMAVFAETVSSVMNRIQKDNKIKRIVYHAPNFE